MKKRTILLLLVLFCCTTIFAQSDRDIKSGDFMLGGRLVGTFEFGNYAQYSDGEEISGSMYNTFLFNIIGEAGYFIIDGLEVGPSIGFSYSDTTNADDASTYSRSTQLLLGVQAGYFFEIGEIFVPFIKASIYYLYINTDSSGTISEYGGFRVIPEGGINLFLNNNVALEASIYFSYESRILFDSSPESSYSRLGYGLSLGVNIFL
ncbi:MAG: outer membrane beta-barrel protein [Spirochaetia bacterium]|jgi:hypothetical protein